MKTSIRLLSYLSIALCFSLVFACGSGGSYDSEESTDESSEATEEVAEEPMEEPAPEIKTAMMVSHMVEDWDMWKEEFDNHDSTRTANGFGKASVYVDVENSNSVTVFAPSKDHDAARGFASSEDLKSAMEKSGVAGEPTIIYLDMVELGDEKYETMDRLLIIHEVEDFDSWKKAFDDDSANRDESELGFIGMATSNDNPNEVGIMFAVNDKDKAQAMLGSEDMKETMKNAGVQGEPRISWLVQKQ